MNRAHKLLSLLPILLLLSPITACHVAESMFGPKDEGGLYLVISVKAEAAQLEQSISQTMTVMEKRCDQLGIRCKLQRQGGDKSNQIMLRISSPQNPERIKSVLFAEGMELRAVVSPPSPAPLQTYATQGEAAAVAGTDKAVLPYLEREEGAAVSPQKFVVVERTPIVTGQHIRHAEAVGERLSDLSGGTAYSVIFRLNPTGAEHFGRWTGANINKYLAVVLNKQVRSVAFIKSQIFDSGQISGHFTKQQADDIAIVLMSGNLPAGIEPLEEGTYKP
jgi:preprotein translocase subunit SecD